MARTCQAKEVLWGKAEKHTSTACLEVQTVWHGWRKEETKSRTAGREGAGKQAHRERNQGTGQGQLPGAPVHLGTTDYRYSSSMHFHSSCCNGTSTFLARHKDSQTKYSLSQTLLQGELAAMFWPMSWVKMIYTSFWVVNLKGRTQSSLHHILFFMLAVIRWWGILNHVDMDHILRDGKVTNEKESGFLTL